MSAENKIQIGDSIKTGPKANIASLLEKPKTSHGTGPNKMTERERLQASLRQTLTEFKEMQTKEKRVGQGAQGGQKAANNRLVGNYLVGKYCIVAMAENIEIELVLTSEVFVLRKDDRVGHVWQGPRGHPLADAGEGGDQDPREGQD